MMIRYYSSVEYKGLHPIEAMRELGFRLIKGLSVSVADLWFFEVDSPDMIVPWFLEIVDEESVKSLPDWPLAIDFTQQKI
jgi:hypothetical protein